MRYIKAIYGLFLTLLFTKKFDVKIFKGKRIAIIGPASSIKEKVNGEFIDGFDFVIRINKSIVQWNKEDEKYVGSKTDILIHSMYENNESGGGKIDFELFNRHGVSYLLNPKNNFEGWRLMFNYYKKYLSTNNVYFLSRKVSKPCLKLFPKGIKPTIGFFAIYTALTSKCDEIFITGFTFFRTPYAKGYRDNLIDMGVNKQHIQNHGIHNPDLEFNLFLDILKSTHNKDVILDNTLTSIVENAELQSSNI